MYNIIGLVFFEGKGVCMNDNGERNNYRMKRRRKKKRLSLFGKVVVVVFWGLLLCAMYFAGNLCYEKIKSNNVDKNVNPPAKKVESVIPQSKNEPSSKPENSKPEASGNFKYADKFGDAKFLVHIHKRSYKLELFEKGNNAPLKEYGVAVAKNFGDKQRSGDNTTPTSWGNVERIPSKYKGAKYKVQSKDVPFRVEEICDARGWTHDFGDGKGVIAGAYGPWFISLDTGWNGIGIHGTHDPNSIGTNASEGCIRLKNDNVKELKTIISKDNGGIGTAVIITED